MKTRTVFVNDRELLVELIQHHNDPGSWIVRSWAKGLFWFKKRISSYRFIDGPQALKFAEELKRKHIGP